MDVNGTRYHLLLGKSDWEKCHGPSGSDIFDDTSKSMCKWNERFNDCILNQIPFTFKGGAKSKRLTLESRRGAACDRFGNWFWISDDQKQIQIKLSGSGSVVPLWNTDNPAAFFPVMESSDFSPVKQEKIPSKLVLRGLTITDDHHLIAGTCNPSGILLFDLYSRTAPRHLIFPEETGITPFDCSPAPGGGAWILDRGIELGSKWRLWRIDGNFFVAGVGQKISRKQNAATGFELSDKLSDTWFPGGISGDDSIKGDAIAVDTLPDGSAIVLMDIPDKFPMLVRCRWDAFSESWISDSIELQQPSSPPENQFTDYLFGMRPFDFACRGVSDRNELTEDIYVVTEEGNQAFKFRLNIDCESEKTTFTAIPEYFPMRLFGGKGVTAYNRGIYYDFADGWLPLIDQYKPRFELAGEFTTVLFDSNQIDCVWHRCMFDAEIRSETSVTVWSRASNSKESLSVEPWNQEPPLYKRATGTELPFTKTSTDKMRYDTWELLLQKAKGRYIQLRCRLTGDGRTTPRLRALRIYYPRFSYLERYLPSVYRDNPESASFLDRFLANFEGVLTSIEDRVAAVQVLLDYRSAPADALEWLGDFISVVFEPSWDEARRRLFIHNAPVYFRNRGTVGGVLMALRLGFGDALEKTIDDTLFSDTVSRAQLSSRIMIKERFVQRTPPRFSFKETFAIETFPRVNLNALWTPAEGGKTVDIRYRVRLSNYFGAQTILESPVYQMRSPAWRALNEKLSIGQTELTIDVELEDYALMKAYKESLKGNAGSADEEYVTLMIKHGDDTVETTVDEWNTYIAQKTAVWRAFSLQTFGFVPSCFEQEWRSWTRFLAGQYSSVSKLNEKYGTSYKCFEDIPWPSDKPQSALAQDWSSYLKITENTAAAGNRKRWQQFCSRRYSRIRALNDVYGTEWDSFEMLALPHTIPQGGAALRDWYQFETIVLPMHASAHRFQVLLPLTTELLNNSEKIEKQMQLAKRIVQMQKPAHAVFDVRFYWAAFTVGKAALGIDTIIDHSSRFPYFLTKMILGRGHLAESYLDSPYRPEGRPLIANRSRIREKSDFHPDNDIYHCISVSHKEH